MVHSFQGLLLYWKLFPDYLLEVPYKEHLSSPQIILKLVDYIL